MVEWEIEEYEGGWKLDDPEDAERRIEVLPETAGDWSAELYHHYGATRIVLMKTDDGRDVLERLVEQGHLEEDQLP